MLCRASSFFAPRISPLARRAPNGVLRPPHPDPDPDPDNDPETDTDPRRPVWPPHPRARPHCPHLVSSPLPILPRTLAATPVPQYRRIPVSPYPRTASAQAHHASLSEKDLVAGLDAAPPELASSVRSVLLCSPYPSPSLALSAFCVVHPSFRATVQTRTTRVCASETPCGPQALLPRTGTQYSVLKFNQSGTRAHVFVFGLAVRIPAGDGLAFEFPASSQRILPSPPRPEA
ncbi:hypothetical protein C8Q79DRAFT_1008877 [Trametes meyenii]|nr:hypothetical protein C8Q79DRAFT_1008877 [Trametes meyenii]